MGLVVSELRQTPVSEQELEIVERKGLGHPDHICDAVMNEVSISLSREYIKRYGIVMHHNIDKALLAAGAVRRNFGGGEVKRPMLMVFGDRATYEGPSRHIQPKRKILRRKRHISSSRVRPAHRYRENRPPHRTLHQLSQLQERIP